MSRCCKRARGESVPSVPRSSRCRTSKPPSRPAPPRNRSRTHRAGSPWPITVIARPADRARPRRFQLSPSTDTSTSVTAAQPPSPHSTRTPPTGRSLRRSIDSSPSFAAQRQPRSGAAAPSSAGPCVHDLPSARTSGRVHIPNTSNSRSDVPPPCSLRSTASRTYLASSGSISMTSHPPSPSSVSQATDQRAPSVESWISYPIPGAPPQSTENPHTGTVRPRSACHHGCSSSAAARHSVARFPSAASPGPYPSCWLDADSAHRAASGTEIPTAPPPAQPAASPDAASAPRKVFQ